MCRDISKLVQGILLGLFSALLDLFQNKDDLVKRRSFGWTRSALQTFANKNIPVSNGFYFNGGGGGNHTLYLWIAQYIG